MSPQSLHPLRLFDKREKRDLGCVNPMRTTSAKLLHEALTWRYATKKLDASRKIPPATWAALEESLVLAPSTFGIQPWKFLVIQDPAIRGKLGRAPPPRRLEAGQ